MTQILIYIGGGAIAIMMLAGFVKIAIMDTLFSTRKWFERYAKIHGKILIGLSFVTFQNAAILLIKFLFE